MKKLQGNINLKYHTEPSESRLIHFTVTFFKAPENIFHHQIWSIHPSFNQAIPLSFTTRNEPIFNPLKNNRKHRDSTFKLIITFIIIIIIPTFTRQTEHVCIQTFLCFPQSGQLILTTVLHEKDKVTCSSSGPPADEWQDRAGNQVL